MLFITDEYIEEVLQVERTESFFNTQLSVDIILSILQANLLKTKSPGMVSFYSNIHLVF